MIEGLTNARVASAPLPSPERSLVIAVAKGAAKLPGIRVSVGRPLVNGLITDEWTAEKLLAGREHTESRRQSLGFVARTGRCLCSAATNLP